MMKKKFTFALLLAILGLNLAACGTTNQEGEDDSATRPTEPTTSEVTPSPSSSEEDTFKDYAHDGSCLLGLDYKDHDFFKDGIGQVTLKTCIDGDTAHFEPVVTTTSSETIKARFFGIDTPESTGKVQEWGKPASNFTKQILTEAAENGTIVVSSAQSTYGTPNLDSTGVRYVSLVWVNTEKKNADYTELALLNLWIVQEGLSWVKNVNDMPEYIDVFRAAQSQAEKFKKNMFSGEPDPYFNYGDYEDVSILDMKREIEKSILDASYVNKYNNKKVRFTGTVAGYSNNTLYVQEYYPNDEDDPSKGGEYAGINIFTGMSTISSKFTTVNTYVEICGLAQDSETFGFQITDTQGHFPVTSDYNDNDCRILLKAADNTDEHSLYKFSYTASELNAQATAGKTDNLNCYTTVTTEVTVKRQYTSTDESEVTLYLNDYDWNIYITFIYKNALRGKNHKWTGDEWVGYSFTVTGVYCYHRTTSGKIVYQMVPSQASDLVCTNTELLAD